MGDAELLYERRGAVAVITFNRPQARNAMTFAMYEALYERCDDFDSGQTGVDYEARIDRYIGRVDRVRKPTIALVDGYAVGAGLSIAGACDLRICTPDAKFGLPIARTLGNCVSMAGYARLAAMIG